MDSLLSAVLCVCLCLNLAAGQQLGQYAALPWSLAWLNPSYTGFYGGIGNIGQLNPDSSYLGGNGGQFGAYGGRNPYGQGGYGGGGGYNYATGLYGSARSLVLSPCICSLWLMLILGWFA